MKVVATVKFGWGVGDLVRQWWAGWGRRHPGWYAAARFGWAALQHPFHSLGVVLVGWLLWRGWPLPVAMMLGTLPPLLWSLRSLVRIGAVPPGPQYLPTPQRFRQALEAFRRLRVLQRHWERAATYAKITNADGQAPKLLNVRPTDVGIEALLPSGTVGATADKVAAMAEVIGATLNCRKVTVVEGDTLGQTWLHFQWADPLGRRVPLHALPLPPHDRLAYGLTDGGEAATIVATLSVFVAGVTNAGKSTVLWALMASALATGIPIRYHVIDPSGGVELFALQKSPLVDSYGSNVSKAKRNTELGKTANEVIAEFHEQMMARTARMAGNGRYHKPTQAEPLQVLVIDEMLRLRGKMTPESTQQLEDIVSMGRKVAFAVWGLAQLTAKDDIGAVRDLFPQRIALAMPTRIMTDTMLGDGSESSGAKCSKLRVPGQAGMGYAAIDEIPGLTKFRGAYVSDAEAKLIARGILPARVRTTSPQLQLERTEVVYAWFAPRRLREDCPRDWRANETLYIGKSNDAGRRSNEHLEGKAWTNVKGVHSEILAVCPDEVTVLAMERDLIHRFLPKENIAHSIRTNNDQYTTHADVMMWVDGDTDAIIALPALEESRD